VFLSDSILCGELPVGHNDGTAAGVPHNAQHTRRRHICNWMASSLSRSLLIILSSSCYCSFYLLFISLSLFYLPLYLSVSDPPLFFDCSLLLSLSITASHPLSHQDKPPLPLPTVTSISPPSLNLIQHRASITAIITVTTTS
jgi:hypothetical protein